MINIVRWDITGKCNLNCEHCQASEFYKNHLNKKDLTTSQVFIIIDKLSKYGVKRVGILGGEPLLRKDIIEILRYFKEKDIRVELCTNLVLLDNFNIQEILNNVETITISIDGTCAQEHDRLRGKGNFDISVNNIKKLVCMKDKQKIGISMVLDKYNYKSSKNIFPFMKDLGVDICMVDVVHKTGNAIQNWDKLSLNNDKVVEAICDLINNWDFNSSILLQPRMYANKFRDLLYNITGIKLIDKLVWDAPGKTSFYILNDGTILPSQMFAYRNNIRKFESKSLLNYSLEDIIIEKDFTEFLSLYDLNLPEKYYEPCKNCSYCGRQCNPSPVTYWFGRKKTPIELCSL